MGGNLRMCRLDGLQALRQRWLALVLLCCTPGLVEPLACVIHCALMPRTAVLLVVQGDLTARLSVVVPGGLLQAHELCDSPGQSSAAHQHPTHILPLPIHDVSSVLALAVAVALLLSGAAAVIVWPLLSYAIPPLLPPPRSLSGMHDGSRRA